MYLLTELERHILWIIEMNKSQIKTKYKYKVKPSEN